MSFFKFLGQMALFSLIWDLLFGQRKKDEPEPPHYLDRTGYNELDNYDSGMDDLDIIDDYSHGYENVIFDYDDDDDDDLDDIDADLDDY